MRLRGIFSFVYFLGLLLPRLVAAQEANTTPTTSSLTERDVIAIARTSSPGVHVANAAIALADAQQRTAGLLPNPEISWGRETVETGPVGSQDIVTAALPINLFRPRAQRALVAVDSTWQRAVSSASRETSIAEALLAYYELVFEQRHVEILRRSLEHLQEAERVLERREAAGAASGYERIRLTIASSLRESELAEARGALNGARVQLACLLNLPVESTLASNELTVLSLQGAADILGGNHGSHEALKWANASEQSANQAVDRTDWVWLPELEVSGGMKHVSDLGGGYGYVVGLALNLPIFDRGQALSAEADALKLLSATRTKRLEATLSMQAQQAFESFQAAHQELERFSSKAPKQVDALLVAAQSGYREGERSIVELLDAQKARTDVEMRVLDLLTDAKRAEAQLRAAVGGFE